MIEVGKYSVPFSTIAKTAATFARSTTQSDESPPRILSRGALKLLYRNDDTHSLHISISKTYIRADLPSACLFIILHLFFSLNSTDLSLKMVKYVLTGATGGLGSQVFTHLIRLVPGKVALTTGTKLRTYRDSLSYHRQLDGQPLTSSSRSTTLPAHPPR